MLILNASKDYFLFWTKFSKKAIHNIKLNTNTNFQNKIPIFACRIVALKEGYLQPEIKFQILLVFFVVAFHPNTLALSFNEFVIQ